MVTQARYSISTRLPLPYDEALQRVKDALKEEGFGVLTEIDVKKTLREKLGTDFRRYDIIGACNPQLAHRALQAELDIGLLLPCNVVVYEDDGGSVVAAFDPEAAMGLAENPGLSEIAREAKERLVRALEKVG
ncbi:MAG: DUF302 domain-containing protein [Chloroflexi bacterium]|nr:DUF302 domain-containing protein [Chloroflexota bacterium]